MGRNYYCEYCDKRMKNDLNVRKKHLDGIPHKIARAEYMAPYRDPNEILEKESTKAPCPRFHSGRECKFGLYCHFSHYTKEQLEELSRLVRTKVDRNYSKEYNDCHGDSSENRKIDASILWKYPQAIYSKELTLNIPPSLQPINFQQIPLEVNEWG